MRSRRTCASPFSLNPPLELAIPQNPTSPRAFTAEIAKNAEIMPIYLLCVLCGLCREIESIICLCALCDLCGNDLSVQNFTLEEKYSTPGRPWVSVPFRLDGLGSVTGTA